MITKSIYLKTYSKSILNHEIIKNNLPKKNIVLEFLIQYCTGSLWWTDSNAVPMIITSWYPCLCINPLPLQCVRTCDLLLISWKWQESWDITFMSTLHVTVTFILSEDSLCYWLWRRKLLGCQLAFGERHMASNWQWFLVNSQQKPKLRPSIHQLPREQNTANNQISLKIDPFPIKPQMRPQPWKSC